MCCNLQRNSNTIFRKREKSRLTIKKTGGRKKGSRVGSRSDEGGAWMKRRRRRDGERKRQWVMRRHDLTKQKTKCINWRRVIFARGGGVRNMRAGGAGRERRVGEGRNWNDKSSYNMVNNKIWRKKIYIKQYTSVIFIFLEFLLFFCIFTDFLKIQIPFCEKNTLLHTRLHRPPGAIFEWFCNFPYLSTCLGCMENCQTFQKLHLVVFGNANVKLVLKPVYIFTNLGP